MVSTRRYAYTNQHRLNRANKLLAQQLATECSSGCQKTHHGLQMELKICQQSKTGLQELLNSLVELSPFPIMVVCLKSGQILLKNQLIEPFFGVESGKTLDKITTSFCTQPALWFDLVKQLYRGKTLTLQTAQLKKANGTSFEAGISAKSVNYEGKRVALLTFTDETEQLKIQQRDALLTNAMEFSDTTKWRQVETELKIRERQQRAVAELGQRALANTDLSVLMDETVRLVAQVLDVKLGGILELLPGGHILLLQAGVGWHQGLVGSAMSGTQPSSLLGHTLLTSKPVIVNDLRVETRFDGSPLLHNHRVVSGISVTIATQGKAFGILGAYATQERVFTNDDSYFLQTVANVLALAIERKQSEDRLHLMERAIAASSNGIVLTDALQADNPIIYVNPAFEEITGYPASEILGKNCRFLQGSERDQPALNELRNAILEQRDCHVTLRNYRKDGTLFWNELYIAPVFDSLGFLTHFIGVQTDMTQQQEALLALRQREEQYRSIVETAAEGIWLLNQDNQTTFVNQQMANMLGYTTEEMLGKTLFSFMDEEGVAITNANLERCHQGIHEMHDFKFQCKDGSPLWAIVSCAPLFDEQKNYAGALGMVTNITERKHMEEKLVYQAFYDALTGLPNRVLFMERLGQAIAQVKNHPENLFAVLFLDLDRFKVVNDSLGHAVGDQLLIAIAQRLQSCLRQNDTVARLGGDEFTILLSHIQTIEDTTLVAERIHQVLKSPFNLNGSEVFTSASIGIAVGTNRYDEPANVLRDADTALYHAKEQGKSGHVVFDTVMYEQAVALLQLETQLRWAIERQELRVYYQPIVSVSTGAITGFEALVRWQHPQQGMISPDKFIPIAEETGLIVSIGQWVLREACHQLRQWQKQFPALESLSMNVNLSAKQFSQPNVVKQIGQILEDTNLAPSSLKLEITESTIMASPETAAAVLKQLKAFGIELCIDDFGTGYSSLAYLHRFPIDVLKIDRSFINQIDSDRERLAIVRAIVTLGSHLGLSVVAEGVETMEQWTQLKLLQCAFAQGYLFSKPLNAEDAGILLATEPGF
ncbi:MULTISPECIES: EAL domain-containing protein [Nostocales]|uniref:Diguanylate cyclase n=4 Tax=Nostocales TaxID=1161 RepID=A0A0C1QWB9_9CYAN|nr:EAL domain-containing protein [Tolypothrix bouteillei]